MASRRMFLNIVFKVRVLSVANIKDTRSSPATSIARNTVEFVASIWKFLNIVS